ncbi:hypothetical protein [Microbacterium gilvum]|uniref:Lipoprotein n=1 Tax=Microbacterium gilvum TaxID=1336204 RepID=A0ABP9AKU7_9MICO
MRRPALAVVLALLAASSLAGCAQATQAAGEALGIPVAELCATADDAYAQYQALLEQGATTEEQLSAGRDDLVATLEGLADDLGGQVGDLVRANAEQLAQTSDLRAPETIEAVEQAKSSVDALCG